jgi:archaemetzincin
VLKQHRPTNALAYIAFTSSDLWPGEGWNFVFGQASLNERVGVWSIYRNGDPAESADAFKLCLSRTMKTATHETGHILGIQHCTAFHCNMNGSNNRAESDRGLLRMCPVCLRKVCWNLQVEPEKYLRELEKFSEENDFEDEAKWYRTAREVLKK